MATRRGESVVLDSQGAAHAGRVSPTEMARVHELTLAGDTSPLLPRPEIGDSWERLRRLGLDPEHGRNANRITAAEVEHRRRESHLAEVLPVLRSTLLLPSTGTPLLFAVADAEGHVLWQEGARHLRRSADGIGFDNGACWSEDAVGTNGIGMTLRVRRPMQVHSTEHYLRSHHAWTCVAAPVHDPRTGRLTGVVDLSGPARTMAPYLLQLAATAARLAEAELRARQLEALHQLRTVAAPLLARVAEPAMVVDDDGWTAATHGLPPVARLRLPADGWASSDIHWLPALGECAVEPMAGGWLIRPVSSSAGAIAEQTERAALRLDLGQPGHPKLLVTGAAGSWSHALSPRHAELLLLLAVNREGLSAAQLAEALFADRARTVTVRAEISRLRRYLGGLLEHRPYRIAHSASVSVTGPADPYDLLPTSSAPAVRELRAGLLTGSCRLPR
ncbi:helix-turn-helix domain-containing protein [Saccharothrix sp. ST-888]|uniref:helix-turn-helix domain-containing protein n=1 Tax=Saccharothrix sp. ST-888 TaxID=1427391 RepID=UPI0005ED2314|nr:helix-turn-helix domain-containing protein [Saccharothrix sp. ST-888]